MDRQRKGNNYSQAEFPFAGVGRKTFGGHKLEDLGELPVAVICPSLRAARWLRAQGIATVGDLVALVSGRLLAGRCLDQALRREIGLRLKPFWNGRAYRPLVAVSLLSCGVEKILGDRAAGSRPVSSLELSATLQAWLKAKGIGTLRDLLLQDEEALRGHRQLGNLLVDEIIVGLVRFLSKEPTTPE